MTLIPSVKFAVSGEPWRVFAADMHDQNSRLAIDPKRPLGRTTSAPVEAETASAADHYLRLDDPDRVQRHRVQSIQPLQRQASMFYNLTRLRDWFEHYQFFAQEEILGLKPRSSHETRSNGNQPPD